MDDDASRAVPYQQNIISTFIFGSLFSDASDPCLGLPGVRFLTGQSGF